MTIIDEMVKSLEDRLLVGLSLEEIKIVEKFCDCWLRKAFYQGMNVFQTTLTNDIDWCEKKYRRWINRENKEVSS